MCAVRFFSLLNSQFEVIGCAHSRADNAHPLYGNESQSPCQLGVQRFFEGLNTIFRLTPSKCRKNLTAFSGPARFYQ